MGELDALVRSVRSACVATLCAVTAAVCFRPPSADAHAFPVAEQPAVGSTVTAPPTEVAITFDNPIEALFATLAVVDGSGHEQADGPPTAGPDHRRLSVRLKRLMPGEYSVKWSVVAVDGHHTEGSYTFSVAGGER